MKKWVLIIIAFTALVIGVLFSFPVREGYIKIDSEGVEMQLDGGWFCKPKISSGTEQRVSARVYRPRYLSIKKKQNEKTWELRSSGLRGKLGKIKVKKEETTVLKLGSPFLVKANVRKGNGRIVLIDYSIIGQAGEHYSPGVTKNTKRLPAPRFEIVDETGKVLASGKFEYG